MSTTTDSASSPNANPSENQKQDGNKKKESIDEKEIIKIKESKFYELINMLKKWGFNVTDKSKEIQNKDIEYKAEILPPVPYSSGLSTPIFLEFQNDLDDGFIIRTTFELDVKIQTHLKEKNKAKEQELMYIELEQLILPIKVSMIRIHPLMNLYKVIFYDDLKKQFLLDSINDLISSMSLVIGKWKERYFEIIQENK